MGVVKTIRQIGLEQLKLHPEGLRYTDLRHNIEKVLPPGMNPRSIRGSIYDLDKIFPLEVYKPARGLFRLIEFRDQNADQIKPELVPQVSQQAKELDFYEPFADWLKNQLEECDRAIPLGGKIFGDKWGTPDVIGIRESKKGDIIMMPIEVVSAEIKTDTFQLITAFGQACAYRLFSHKSFLVIPSTSLQDDIDRLDSLCLLSGIGLILFDLSVDEPNFSIRTRPQKHEPDMYYANKYLGLIREKLW